MTSFTVLIDGAHAPPLGHDAAFPLPALAFS
jgi:hypothetical protein